MALQIKNKLLKDMTEITQTTILLLSGLAVLHWMQFAK